MCLLLHGRGIFLSAVPVSGDVVPYCSLQMMHSAEVSSAGTLFSTLRI